MPSSENGLDRRRVNTVRPKAPPNPEETAAGLPGGYSLEEYELRRKRLIELEAEGHPLGTWFPRFLASCGYRSTYKPHMPPGTVRPPRPAASPAKEKKLREA